MNVDDEPELWRRSPTGEIDLWVDFGQLDERRIRKACGRAREVVVYTYAARKAEVWWKQIAPKLERFDNLAVVHLDDAGLADLYGRNLHLQAMIDGGELRARRRGGGRVGGAAPPRLSGLRSATVASGRKQLAGQCRSCARGRSKLPHRDPGRAPPATLVGPVPPILPPWPPRPAASRRPRRRPPPLADVLARGRPGRAPGARRRPLRGPDAHRDRRCRERGS